MEFKITEKLKGGNKATATGTSLSLQNSIYHCIKKLVFDGRSTQKTRSGKNLFNSALIPNVTISGVTWVVQDDGGINISGSNTSTSNVSNPVGGWSSTEPIIELDPTKTYTLSFSGNYDPAKVQFESRGLKNNAISTITGTLSKPTTITGFSSITYLNFYAIVGATDLNETIYFMLEEGSTASNEFEQYGASPSPDYPSKIESIDGIVQYKQIGDNIFNKNNVSFTLNAEKDVLDTGVRATVSVTGKYRYIAIKLGGSELLGKKITIQTKITPSANNEGQISLFYGTSTSLNSKYRIVDVNTTNPTNAYILNTFPDNFDTIWCCFYGNLTGIGNVGDYVDYTDMMIVMGDSIADGYKPYQETILNIDLQGNKLCSLANGVKDELIVENGRAKIIKRVQEDLLDGVNKKFTRIDLRGDKTFLICNYANTNIKIATSENEVIPYSDKFKSSSITGTWQGIDLYGVSQAPNGHYLQFSFPKDMFTDLTINSINSWFASNNVKVQYELETTQTIDLGEVTMPKTFEGVNNISNSANANMELTYFNGSLDLSNLEYSIKEV